MAGSHIELRKRQERQAKKIGTRNPVKVADPLDKKKPINKWVVAALGFVVLGSILFEFADKIFAAFYPTTPVAKVKV